MNTPTFHARADRDQVRQGRHGKFTALVACGSTKDLRFQVTTKPLDSDLFCFFLAGMLSGAATPVIVVVDGSVVTRSGKVGAFVAGTEGRLRVFHRHLTAHKNSPARPDDSKVPGPCSAGRGPVDAGGAF